MSNFNQPPSYPEQTSYGYRSRPEGSTNPLAVVSLVLSVASFIFFPLLAGIAGVITGHISLRQIKRDRTAGHGLALAGVIVGYVNIALSIIVGIALAVLLIFAINDSAAQMKEIKQTYQSCVQAANGDQQLEDQCYQTYERQLNQFNGDDDNSYTDNGFYN